MRRERLQISRTNYIKPRRIWQRNVQNAVPRARRKILLTVKLGVSEPVNKLSEPRHRNQTFTTESATEGIQDASDW